MTKNILKTLIVLTAAAALLPAVLPAAPEGPSARKFIALTDKPADTPYTPAILVKDTLYVSGQIAVDPETGKLVGTTMTEQAERVIANIEILCRKAGMRLSHVVETTAFITDLAEFAEFNAVYRKHFPTAPPTRATVQVVKLAMGAKIEISAVAVSDMKGNTMTFEEIEKQLPKIPESLGNYVDCVRTGNLLFISGKGTFDKPGVVGRDLDKETAYARARETGLILLAVMKRELGTLQRVKRVVKILGFVNAVPGFAQQPYVINGCSDLMVEVFGEAGRHARSAVGVGSLPLNIPVEIEAIVEVTD